VRPEDEASERRVIVPLTIVHYTRFGMLEVELKDDGYKIVGESDQTTDFGMRGGDLRPPSLGWKTSCD
jgi:hypothetical protein